MRAQKVIDSFTWEYEFLSNFYPSHVNVGGVDYKTVEHAYQAMKTLSSEEREWVRAARGPGEAKRRGRMVTKREDWEEIKELVMYLLLRVKFSKSSSLSQRLLATGDAELIEGNTWGDRYWGVSYGEGQNKLGKLLMLVREDLRA